MRAGLLRGKASFLELTTAQSASGASKKTWTTVFTLRCSKIKTQGTGTEINASEVFNGVTVQIYVRRHDSIKYGQHVVIGTTVYEIELIDEHITDNCIELTLKRINQ